MRVELILANKYNEFLLVKQDQWTVLSEDVPLGEKPEQTAIRMAAEQLGYELTFFTKLQSSPHVVAFLGILDAELDALTPQGDVRLVRFFETQRTDVDAHTRALLADNFAPINHTELREQVVAVTKPSAVA